MFMRLPWERATSRFSFFLNCSPFRRQTQKSLECALRCHLLNSGIIYKNYGSFFKKGCNCRRVGFCKSSSRSQTNETATCHCNLCRTIWPSTSHPTILSFLAEAWPMVGHIDQNDICVEVEPCPPAGSAQALHDRETSTLQANQAHLGVSLSIQP